MGGQLDGENVFLQAGITEIDWSHTLRMSEVVEVGNVLRSEDSSGHILRQKTVERKRHLLFLVERYIDQRDDQTAINGLCCRGRD